MRPRPPPLNRRATLALAAALPALLTSPQRADAAFGPGGAAVLSKPPLRQLSTEDFLKLSPEKLAQRAGAIGSAQLSEVAKQLDDTFSKKEVEALDKLVDRLEEERKLNPSNSKEVDAEILSLEEKIKAISNALNVAQQLKERDRIERRLGAQPAWVAYGCAALASIGSTLVAHPIDTYKTLQQSGNLPPPPPPQRSGTKKSSPLPDALTSLPPITELYRGLIPNIVKESPSSALYLGIYELVRGKLNGPGGPLASNPLLGYLIAGAIGELVGSVVRAPSEAAKSRVQSGVAATVGEAVDQVVNDPAGRASTVSAWQSSLLRDVPMGAIQIAIFEGAKAYAIQSPSIKFDTNTLLAEAAFGALGGLIGAIVTTPADVVTTRIITRQEAGGASSKGGGFFGGGQKASTAPSEAMGPIETAKEIYADGGWQAFTAGTLSRGLYWAPAISIFLTLYCTLRQLALQLLEAQVLAA